MKITAVKSYTVHPGWRKNLIFVKVETDEGLYRWGESYSQYDRERVHSPRAFLQNAPQPGMRTSSAVIPRSFRKSFTASLQALTAL